MSNRALEKVLLNHVSVSIRGYKTTPRSDALTEHKYKVGQQPSACFRHLSPTGSARKDTNNDNPQNAPNKLTLTLVESYLHDRNTACATPGRHAALPTETSLP